MTTRIFVPARCRRAGARRRRGRRGDRRRELAARGVDAQDRAQRLARRCSGWSRWSRSRRRQGRIAYGPVSADGRRRRCSTPASSTAARIRWRSGRPRRSRSSPGRRGSPSPAAASSIRCRSTTTGAWRLTGLRKALAMAPAGDRRGGDRVRPARPRRRRLPDRHQVEDRARRAGRRRSTSSATPTRATAAPSPTA